MSNPIVDLMTDHRSVRSYEPEVVGRERIRAAVAAAQMASTSSHVQAYSVLNISDRTKRQRLAELCGNQRQVAEAGALLIVCGDMRRHWLLADRAGECCAQNLETFIVTLVDASLFAQNLSLAFESEGLGICYIGGLRNALDEVDAMLELPQNVLPLFGLTVGVPKSRPAKKPRLPIDAVLFEDGYPDDASLLTMIDDFDSTMTAHYTERGVEGRNWSGAIVNRHCSCRRESLAAYYEGKGARLT